MKLKACTAMATAAMISIAQAHPGHDHSDVSAIPIHIVYYGSIAAIIALVGYGVYHLRKKNVQKVIHKDSE